MADLFGAPRDIGPLFQAAYDGELDCGHHVFAGDLISYVDGELFCEECRDEVVG